MSIPEKFEKTGESDLHEEGSWGSRQLGKSKWTMEFTLGGPGYGCIEWDIPGIDLYECIGVWWNPDTLELTDYDGVMSLPRPAAELLREIGINVGEDFE